MQACYNKWRNNNMSTNIKKTQQFLYFQSKAKHYDNMKHIRPSIRSFRESPPSPRPRPHSLLRQYEQMRTNEHLVNNILSIRHSDRSMVEASGAYSRYNDFDIARISKHGTFREAEKYKSIEQDNLTLGRKILTVKPSIGTIADWNANFETVKGRQKIASKLSENKNLSIYSRNQFVPDYYRTFMDRDGSTVAIREKLFELPKVIADWHSKEKRTQPKLDLDLDFRKIIKDTSGEINHPT